MATGMVPSEFFDETIEDKVVPFEKGNVMVLFTDGVTEAENEDREEFGQGRLSEKLSARIRRPDKILTTSCLPTWMSFRPPLTTRTA